MRLFVTCAILFGGIAAPAHAGAISSEYTELNFKTACTTIAMAGPEDGDWADSVCAGWRGYPVFVFYGDARESWHYGFYPPGEDRPPTESFGPFNSAGPKIEWRIETEGEVAKPFATIHRWTVSEPEDSEKSRDVLVIEKVGSPDGQEGCVVGYVVATGDPKANEKARKIADEKARAFVCGTDKSVRIEDGGPLPGLMVVTE